MQELVDSANLAIIENPKAYRDFQSPTRYSGRIYIGGKSEIPSDHVSSRAGDMGWTRIRSHLYVQAVLASCFSFNLRGVESKARRERERARASSMAGPA